MNIGNKIKELRKSKNISQEKLGYKLGVSQAMIAQYENGKRNPKRETLIKIAEALDATILDFLDNELYDVVVSTDAEHEEELIEQKINEIINSSTYSNKEKERELQKLISQLEIMQYFHERNTENAKKLHTIYIDTEGMENHPYNILLEKIKNDEKLTEEEGTYLINYTKKALISSVASLKKFGERLEKHYEALNEDGQKKADEQLNQALENIEMLTQIPKYQINLAELLQDPIH